MDGLGQSFHRPQFLLPQNGDNMLCKRVVRATDGVVRSPHALTVFLNHCAFLRGQPWGTAGPQVVVLILPFEVLISYLRGHCQGQCPREGVLGKTAIVLR